MSGAAAGPEDGPDAAGGGRAPRGETGRGGTGGEEAGAVRVLVVDDDFMVARLHRTLVERTPGFTVVGEARGGAEALAAVRELRPELVLLDMYLPDISGLDVLRALRASEEPGTHGVDVLVVTAARDLQTVRGALRGGAVHYIVKPFEVGTLQERLLQYAHRRRELADLDAADQADLDRVFGGGAGPGGTGAAAPGTARAGRTGGAGGGTAAGGRTGATGAGSGPDPHRAGARAATAAAAASLPKGLTAQTAALVRRTLDGAPEGVSASECAERSGLSRVSARRYLEHFVAVGRAEVTLRYGTTGRPERRYHATTPPPPGTGRGGH